MERELVVGVLGGLGPEATLDYFQKVLRLSGARSDQEHLRLIIDNNPKVPNRNDAVAGRGPSPGPVLAGMARGLEQAGADFLVMACNTAHAFAGDIRAAIRIPFVSLSEATGDALEAGFPGLGRAGILAAGGCREARLYETMLGSRGIVPLTLDDARQARFMALMYAIKGGDVGPGVQAGMRELGELLIEEGAEVVVAACTEVPLVLRDGDLSRPLLDTTEVLARATIAYARRQKPLPAAPRLRAAS
jgi:aspartate racemase